MKLRLYTKTSANLDLLKNIDSCGGKFTSEEHAMLIKSELEGVVKTKEEYLHNYLLGNWVKLSSLEFLIKRIIDNQYNNILSFGSGYCVLEYLLKLSLPKGAKVIATDFDSYLIQKANIFFPEISSSVFNFSTDDMKDFQKALDLKFDIAVFFGSTYVMEDGEFIKLLRGLKNNGMREIVDFNADYMRVNDFLYYFLEPICKSNLIRKLCGKVPIDKNEYIGKFHGYLRSRGELRYLYRKSGLRIVKETSVGPYKYVVMLK